MNIQDTFNSFYNQKNNQSVEVEDPEALDQCMDLIFAWCDTLGIPREAVRHQYAYQVWENATDKTREYFDLITNIVSDPNSKPSGGDIIVFKRIAGIPVGHVSIETGKSNGVNAISFDQNWDTIHYYHIDPRTGARIPYSRLVTHNNYYGIVGWLHPKVVASTASQKVAHIRDILSSSITDDERITQIKQTVDN